MESAIVAKKVADPILNALIGMVKNRALMLWGVKDQLHRLVDHLEVTQAHSKDAETWAEQDAINLWVRKLQDFVYEAQDVVELCLTERDSHRFLLDHQLQPQILSQLCNSSSTSSWIRCLPGASFCRQISFGLVVGRELARLDGVLQQINQEGQQLVKEISSRDLRGGAGRKTSPYLEVGLVGKDVQQSKHSLVNSITEGTEDKLLVLAIVGTGGIGKTRLAKELINDETVSRCFAFRVWLYVPPSYSSLESLTAMVKQGAGDFCKDAESLAFTDLESRIAQLDAAKPVFLVLDNVWRGEVLKDVCDTRVGHCNVRIVVTTRNRAVAREIGAKHVHVVPNLSTDDAWELLRREAILRQHEITGFEDIGKQIVGSCDALPLAAKLAGEKLRHQKSREKWKDFLEGKEALKIVRGELESSYMDLTRELKHCFNYCSLLPPGFDIPVVKLVRLWVAEGFIVEDNLTMEKRAEGNYEELVHKNFLQPHHRDPCCRVNSLLHAFAVSLVNQESFCGDVNQLSSAFQNAPKLRRLSLSCDEEVLSLPAEIEFSCLRTLLLLRSPDVSGVEDSLFNQLPHLRVLDLSSTAIVTLPDSLLNLKLLKHLDLSNSRISNLPKVMSVLKSLQFLILTSCSSLRELPPSITKLCNLRELAVEGTPLTHLPKGMGALKNLRHLRGYVADNARRAHRRSSSSLEELKSLSKLIFLSLFHPNKASAPADHVLQGLTSLSRLQLHCHDDSASSSLHRLPQQTPVSQDVLDKLCPPSCLEELTIICCFLLPSWMSTQKLNASLPHLTKLVLKSWMASQLPPLGQIPRLHHLEIDGAENVESIGDEFLGGSSAFPMLERLILHKLTKWKEWKVEDGGEGSGAVLLPRLKYLEIADCPNLMALPGGLRRAIALQEMQLFQCSQLKHDENFYAVKKLIHENKAPRERLPDLVKVASMEAETSARERRTQLQFPEPESTISLGPEEFDLCQPNQPFPYGSSLLGRELF